MKVNFDKGGGLVPAVVQDADTGTVLMVGYMNQEALDLSRSTGQVTFFSRSKGRLWTKGEISGNFLTVVDIRPDCDDDALLVWARPSGPVCHTGSASCFGEGYSFKQSFAFLERLAEVIRDRNRGASDTSYTKHLLDKGTRRIAQKVGEEAVELVIEASSGANVSRGRLASEAADLLYHLMVLLESCDLSLPDVVAELERRHTSAD